MLLFHTKERTRKHKKGKCQAIGALLTFSYFNIHIQVCFFLRMSIKKHLGISNHQSIIIHETKI